MTAKYIEHNTTVRVRFSEVDSLRIVWHGHYAKYFEDAREAFGRAYGLSYGLIVKEGYLAPMTTMNVEFLRPARTGDTLEVTCRLMRNRAAKLHFEYEVKRDGEEALLARGSSTQVFLKQDWGMVLTQPKFLREFWKDNGSGIRDPGSD